MGVRNKKRETLRRLDSKTLDARFLNEIKTGLNCSPFEAEAVLDPKQASFIRLQCSRAGDFTWTQPSCSSRLAG